MWALFNSQGSLINRRSAATFSPVEKDHKKVESENKELTMYYREAIGMPGCCTSLGLKLTSTTVVTA